MLSLPKLIPIQLIPYKTINYLMQPVTTFFVPQMEKNLPKKKYCKTLSSEEVGGNVQKINVPLIIFTLLLPYNAKFV